jgi:hypothetical protein
LIWEENLAIDLECRSKVYFGSFRAGVKIVDRSEIVGSVGAMGRLE